MTYAHALHVVGRAMRADVPCSVARLVEGGDDFGVGLLLEGTSVAFEDFSAALVELDLAELAR